MPTLTIVDSCGGKPRRLEQYEFDLVGTTPTNLRLAERRSARKTAWLERTPAGDWKFRFRCPVGRCPVDVAVSADLLLQVAMEARLVGASELELADLAARLS